MSDSTLITYDNLQRYHSKLLNLIPTERIWRGNGTPPTGTDHLLAVDYSKGLMFFKNELGGWTVLTGGSGGGGGITNDAELDITNKNPDGWVSKTIAFGGECNILLNCTSIEDERETGDLIIKIIVNGEIESSRQYKQGDVVLPVGEYLKSDDNTVEITVTDVYGNTKLRVFNITTISIGLSSTFGEKDSSQAYQPHFDKIDFRYKPFGFGITKTTYFIVDGNVEEPLTQITQKHNSEETFEIPKQSHGSHTLEVYWKGEIDGQTVESDHLFYDIICVEEGNNTPIIAVPFNISSVKQFKTLVIPWVVYTPGVISSDVVIRDNFSYVQEPKGVSRNLQTLNYKSENTGTIEITFTSGGTTKTISFESIENEIKVFATTDNLDLHLTAKDRRNDEAEENRRIWEYNNISAQLTGFDWHSNGWIEEQGDTVLRVSGSANVYIPFNLFAKDFKKYGKTIEFEFATRNVRNPNAEIITCWNNGVGLKITAQESLLKSQQNEVSRQYKENEHIRVTFVVEKAEESHRISLYINGIESGSVQYAVGDNGDSFTQLSPTGISIGSSDCTTDIYCIRIYDSALSRKQVLHNWIADTQDIELLLQRAEKNDVFGKSDEINKDKIHLLNIPYFVINKIDGKYVSDYSQLPQRKRKDGEAKRYIEGEYVDPLYPERSFTFKDTQIDVQGTSSEGYPRKNYKFKFSGFTNPDTKETQKYYALREGKSVPTNIFTFKTDYASSEGANNVELAMLYDEVNPERTPPQLVANSKVRQGIEGYPCLMFFYDGSNHHFVGKFNFNNDKATAEVFGFDHGLGAESWEITSNNDPAEKGLWKEDDFSDGKWQDTFEARYPEDNTDVSNLQELATWLKSTDTTQATDLKLSELIGVESVTYPKRVVVNAQGLYEVQNKEDTYDTDSVLYRLSKFRNEFEDYVNVNSMIFNYVFLETFLMIDNMRKNSFPTMYYVEEEEGKKKGKWIILPYDFDTAIGINNNGYLKFGYWLENTDYINGTDPVYNGQDSVLYVNMRLAFSEEIKQMYMSVRGNEAFNYKAIEERFEKHQSVWGEAIFNEDSYFKYVEPLINDGTNNLKMLQGSKASQRQWWLYNRFRYLDSKYNTGDSSTDYIMLYANAKHDIDVIPYADIYASADFDSMYSSVRALRGDSAEPSTYTIENPTYAEAGEDADDQVIRIYSASQLSSVGDLSRLQVGYNEFQKATRLTSIKLGDSILTTDGVELYQNTHLEQLNVGENLKLLKSVDVRNCINLKGSVDLSHCSNIEEALFQGTSVSAVALPNGGVLKRLHLPKTVTSLTIRNQESLEEFSMRSHGEEKDDFSNIQRIWLEGKKLYKLFDFDEILNEIKPNSRVRLLDIEMEIETAEEIFALYNRFNNFTGLDENGNETDIGEAISGIIHCGTITSKDLAEMEGKYPSIKIDYEQLVATVKFYNEGEYLTERDIVIGRKGQLIDNKLTDPINDGTPEAIATPSKAETKKSKFVYTGWDNDLENITADTDVNATYKEYWMHIVTFRDDKGNIVQVDGRDTKTYYTIDGESAVTFPNRLDDYTYTDESTGISYKMYFQGWRFSGTEVDVHSAFFVTENEYEEIEIEAYFDASRVYVIRFIDTYIPSNSGEQFLEEGKPINIPVLSRWESANGQYYHNFKGWSTRGANLENKNVGTVPSEVGTEDVTYYAVYDSELRYYDIIFTDWDGSLKQKYENVAWGTTITAPTPSRTGYTFQGWKPSFVNVVRGYAEYNADYKINTYTIRFINEGTVISTQTVEYNKMPDVPSNPTKPSTAEFEYTFKGWDSTPTVATADKDYTAVYTETTRSYTITWVAGESYTTRTVKYGATPSVPSGYEIGKIIKVDGVDRAIVTYGSIDTVSGDRTYYATTKEMATITGQTWDGTKIKNDTNYNGAVISEESSTGFIVEKKALTLALYHIYRNIKIDTEKLIGYKTSIQSVKVNFKCASSGSSSGSNKVGMNPGSIVIAGTDKPKVYVDDSATSITLTLDGSTQSSLVNSNGIAEVYFGLYHPTWGTTKAEFYDISFDITYHK